MTAIKLDKEYWEDKYAKNSTGWNIGYISTPIKEYIDQLKNKDIKILIPGAGNSYEAQYLWENGFRNLFVLDIAKQPLINLKNRVKDIPDTNLIQTDFFNYEGIYDLIIEQTFFCALDPELRRDYAKKAHSLLSDNGKIIGLLFDFELTNDGPPFGGDKQEYKEYFKPYFRLKRLERAYNSIKPRMNKELFFIFEKKWSI